MRRLWILLALAALNVPVLAQTSARDSVRMDVKVYTFQYRSGPDDAFYNCGSGVYATWPDVLADILDRPTRYADYTLVATEGQIVPRGAGETLTNPQLGISVSAGHYGHFPSLGSGAQTGGGYSAECPRFLEEATALASGEATTLNGQPFRITEWYAAFSVPDGTPIALFEWGMTADLTVAFDASFESGQSREVDAAEPGGKRPVASYAWDFGDGGTGSGARPEHQFSEAGEYVVTLVVTDDDGETDESVETVSVAAATSAERGADGELATPALSVPYPNPATASVRVPFAVPEAGPVRLGVYDALGREVAVLVDAPRPAGRHAAEFDASALPAGVYLARLDAGGEVRMQRLTVVR